jgi:hypothetical protein
MIQLNSFKSDLFNTNDANFEKRSLELFNYQASKNDIYSDYLGRLGVKIEEIKALHQIPFMPISFFKNFKIECDQGKAEKVFESSGTSGESSSKHYIKDLKFYHEVSQRAFKLFYGDLSNYHILGFLPSYLERNNASLVEMVRHFIELSGSEYSGFYLNEYERLSERLVELQASEKEVLLIGVTFALLDFEMVEVMDLPKLIVMETGGMKGRGKERTRNEVHSILSGKFNIKNIHSEYGMTELHSQAYSRGNGWFKTPPWMKIVIRDINDPFENMGHGRTGGINIIDLANVDSCAFIETQDLGVMDQKGQFKVLGRMDNSDVRGCNLMLH